MKNLTVENIYTRQTAKHLAKKYFWKLLGMMLLVTVVTTALSIGGTYLVSLIAGVPMDLSGMSLDQYAEAATDSASFNAVFSLALEDSAAMSSPAYILGSLLQSLLLTLVGGGLSLGMISATIKLAQDKEKVKVGQVFSRMKYCLKYFGLGLWMGFKVLLWALPGFAFLIGVYAAFHLNSAYAEEAYALAAAEAGTMVIGIVPLLTILLIFALCIPAVFRYQMAPYILADVPSTGVFACVRESKTMMKGHKWQSFKLCIPYVLALYGWMILLIIILSLAMMIVGEETFIISLIVCIAAFVAMMVLMLIYTMRMAMAYSVFYLKRADKMPGIPPEEEERIVCWQPGVPQTAAEPVATADEHIACWQPGGEDKPEKE